MNTNSPSEPIGGGTHYFEDGVTSTGGPYKSLSAVWSVPPVPSGFGNQTQTYFAFPGLQSSSYILQPVTFYGYAGGSDGILIGGYSWTMANWHCNSGSDCTHSNAVTVHAGDQMSGSIVASGCAAGLCTWTTTQTDITTGQHTTSMIMNETENYTTAFGGAIETYNLGCGQLPITGSFYSGLNLTDKNYNHLTPTWTAVYPQGRSCNANVVTSATAVSLYHPRAYFNGGPPNINTPGTYTYTAVYNDGNPVVSYQWSIKWLITGVTRTLGTAQSQSVHVLSTDDDFKLTLTVSTATGGGTWTETICVFGCG
jgi:hypothetical protein